MCIEVVLYAFITAKNCILLYCIIGILYRMAKSKFKIIIKPQFFEILRKGEWKSFIDSIFEEGSHAINTKKINGCTLLSCATQYGDKEIVEYMIQNGANCNATNFDGSVPLHVAAKHNHYHLLELYLNLSVCVDSRDNMNRTALHYVADKFYGDMEIPPAFESCETFPLMDEDCSVQEQHMELASLLLRHGADVDASDHGGNVPLLLAAKHSCPGVVEMLIRRGADVKCRDQGNWTVLHHASSLGWLTVVQLLVERGVDLDAGTSRGDTALLLAAENSHLEVVELLVKSGANVNSRGMLKTTALHYASREGFQGILNTVQLLVEHKADVNAKTCSGVTPVMLAVKHMRRKTFNYLVESGANLAGCEDKTTILHFACEARWVDVVQSLVDGGSDIDAQTSKGDTPLLIAARQYSKDILEVLIKSGANLNICNPSSYSLLYYACRNDWFDLAHRLVDAGWDVNTKNPDGRTLLMVAATCRDMRIFNYLLEAGADIDCKRSCKSNSFYSPYVMNDDFHKDWTVLHYASAFGRLEIVLCLISKGADVHVKTSKGTTPLRLAILSSNPETVMHLLDAGVDINVIDPEGNTYLHLAVRENNPETVMLLLEAGVNINAIDFQGNTCLHLAVEIANVKIVKYLINAGADVNATNFDDRTPLFWALYWPKCIKTLVPLLKAGADCNKYNGYDIGTAFEYYVDEANHLKELPLFIESGGYITERIYRRLRAPKHYRKKLLINVGLCKQAILNKFNNLYLYQIYQVPFAVKKLPPLKRMKIAGDGYVAQCIENSVVDDIKINGYCNVTKVQPIVLSLLSVKAFVTHYINSRN